MDLSYEIKQIERENILSEKKILKKNKDLIKELLVLDKEKLVDLPFVNGDEVKQDIDEYELEGEKILNGIFNHLKISEDLLKIKKTKD